MSNNQFAIPGYAPLKSVKKESGTRIRYYEKFVNELPETADTWRLLLYVNFDSPKQLLVGDTSSEQFEVGPPPKITIDFQNMEPWSDGAFKLEVFDVSGGLVYSKWIEVSD